MLSKVDGMELAHTEHGVRHSLREVSCGGQACNQLLFENEHEGVLEHYLTLVDCFRHGSSNETASTMTAWSRHRHQAAAQQVEHENGERGSG